MRVSPCPECRADASRRKVDSAGRDWLPWARQRTSGPLYLDHTLPTNATFGALSATDLDRDGKTDLFSAPFGGTVFEYYLQSSPMAWVKKTVATPDAGYDLAAGDIDGDGCTDVAIADYYQDLVLLKGHDCAP